MNESTDAANIFAPVWKRKWLILLVAIVVAGITYEYYKHQTPNYVAKTSLYLGGANEQQVGLSGASAKASASGREVANQVELINSSIVGKPARQRLKAEGNIAAARAKAKATASASSNFITITTEAHTPRAATALGNAYALEYIKRQRTRYFAQLKTSISIARQQLRRIESQAPTPTKGNGKAGEASKGSAGSTSAIQAATLASKINQLEAGLSGFTGVQQVAPSKANPLPLSPTPKKSAIFGFVLALLLTSVAVYIASQFNRRLSSLSDVEKAFGAQILAALPKVKSPTLRPGGVRGPPNSHVEPLRRLHTSLQLGAGLEPGRGNGPRTLLFLSSDPGDGRSTVIANLARVQCTAGARVVALEADLRRPALGRLLGVDGTHTMAEVLEGRARLTGAMQTVEGAGPAPAPINGEVAPPGGDGAAVSTIVTPVQAGSLSALLNGQPHPNPPALLASAAMQELLRSLADDFDYVLIDAPPPLEVSDVMPLLASVDGIIIIARIGHTRDQSAERLVQLLRSTASAPVLGVVANCVSPKDVERYGFSGAGAQRRGRKLFGR
jgi:Mrp family chromosome partitioning ATPase/capsular polysaccharide biosynthesis protein